MNTIEDIEQVILQHRLSIPDYHDMLERAAVLHFINQVNGILQNLGPDQTLDDFSQIVLEVWIKQRMLWNTRIRPARLRNSPFINDHTTNFMLDLFPQHVSLITSQISK